MTTIRSSTMLMENRVTPTSFKEFVIHIMRLWQTGANDVFERLRGDF